MALIRHRADTLNVARALIGPMIFFMPFVTGFPAGYELLSVVVIYMLIGRTNYILHLHVHRAFSDSRTFNLILELCMGAVSGMTASNWRIQHVYGHHRGKDDLFRGDVTWELERYSPLRVASYCLRSIWPTFYSPYVEAFRKGVLRNETSPFNYRWAFVEQSLSVVLVVLLIAWQPAMALLYAIPIYVVTYLISRYVDYLNHYSCDEASADIHEHANNSLSPTFNFLNNNFGYHTAHHLRPSAHWTELPIIHRGIADKIPDQCVKRVSWSFLLLPYHVYLSRSGRM